MMMTDRRTPPDENIITLHHSEYQNLIQRMLLRNNSDRYTLTE